MGLMKESMVDGLRERLLAKEAPRYKTSDAEKAFLYNRYMPSYERDLQRLIKRKEVKQGEVERVETREERLARISKAARNMDNDLSYLGYEKVPLDWSKLKRRVVYL